MNGRKVAALIGFTALALLPSYMDWKDATTAEAKAMFIGSYLVALSLIYAGVLRA